MKNCESKTFFLWLKSFITMKWDGTYDKNLLYIIMITLGDVILYHDTIISFSMQHPYYLSNNSNCSNFKGNY